MPLLTLLPDGDVTSSWTPIPAGTAYSRVLDLNGPDEDATVLSGGGDGAEFLLSFQRAPALTQRPVSVAWVSMLARLKKTVLPGQTVGAHLKSAGVDLSLPTVPITNTVYADVSPASWRQETDPATGKPWTVDAAFACAGGLDDMTPELTLHGLVCTTARKLMWVEYDNRANGCRGGYRA